MDETGQVLEPLAYHFELRDYLKSEERELWNWFASARARADYTENLRVELLKSTYRLDAEGHPELYQSLEEAKARLGLGLPVTLYQAQNSPQANAALYYMPGEGHLVFSGPGLALLNGAEVKAVIGHELAHYLLWEREGGEFHIADRLIQAAANDPRASTSHQQTARRYQLYTEIFADRGSLRVTGEIEPVVAGLVKLQTGLAQVSGASYLKQAEEIFANGNVATEGVSHPEAFIRARALGLWQGQGEAAAGAIRAMIEGAGSLEDLDLMDQHRLSAVTRRVLGVLLRPKWFQTPAIMGHAKLFFSDFQPASRDDAELAAAVKSGDPAWVEYLSYVLLDFTKADPDLDEMPLAAAFELSRRLELEATFEKLAGRELRMKARELRRIKEQAGELLAKAEAADD